MKSRNPKVRADARNEQKSKESMPTKTPPMIGCKRVNKAVMKVRQLYSRNPKVRNGVELSSLQ